jgi:uncharacterized protein (UPF0305 family)
MSRPSKEDVDEALEFPAGIGGRILAAEVIALRELYAEACRVIDALVARPRYSTEAVDALMSALTERLKELSEENGGELMWPEIDEAMAAVDASREPPQ